MTKQVLSIEQMLHLQKLGIEPQETLLYWAREVATEPRAANHYGKWILVKGKGRATIGLTHWEYVPAYTLQDILDILPSEIVYLHTRRFLCIDIVEQYICYYTDTCDGKLPVRIFDFRNGKPLIDAAYTALIWCIRKGFINPRKEARP